MPRKIFLLSGHTSTGGLKDLDKRVIDESEDNNVLVLNLTFDDKGKLKKKEEFFKNYFKELGAENVWFFSDDNPNYLLFDLVDLLYLPGGKTEKLMQKIKEHSLVNMIKGFPGIVSGNSAGAYVMCPEYLKLRDDVSIMPMIGMVNFWVKAHYEEKFDRFLLPMSEDRLIYGLENNSAIIYNDGLEFVGNVWRFDEGKKVKC